MMSTKLFREFTTQPYGKKIFVDLHMITSVEAHDVPDYAVISLSDGKSFTVEDPYELLLDDLIGPQSGGK